MFYDYVKSKLEAGTVVVDPPVRGNGGNLKIKAKGIAAIAVMFLSRKEKEQIESLSKFIAMRRTRVSYYDSGY